MDGAIGVDEGRDLEALLGFQIQMAHMLMIGAARNALEPFDMTPARLAALLLIRSNPGCDQSALGRALSVNRSSAMKLVNLLIQRDLIERRPGRDMRSHALYVKPAGETRLARMIAAVRRTEDFPEDALSPAERDMLVGLLRKLRVAMAGSAEADGGRVGEAL